MLGDSTALGGGGASSGDDAAAAAAASAGGVAEPHDGGESAVAAAGSGGGGAGSNSGEEGGGGDRSFGGNRWPRQETLALLKIRSDMDVAFRDASVKGPLWDEVSRKLAELGYQRSAKKCKEKFENVYKYHKRTKDGRTGKPYGKTYRFFDQLEALDHHHQNQNQPHNANSLLIQSSPSNSAPLPAPPVSVIPTTQPPPSVMVAPQVTPPPPPPPPHVNAAATTVPSMNTTSIPPLYPPPPALAATTTITANPTFLPSFASIPTDLLSNSSSSSTSSDETIEARRRRKRKWKDFFERLMKEVIEKQEELQKRFLEAIEKREHERMVREESWRMQEMARINKEREILAQERSIAAAKDAAVMAFLQKIAEQQNLGQTAAPTTNNINIPNPPTSQPTAAPAPVQAPVIAPPQPLHPVTVQQSTSILSTPPPAPPPSTQQGITSMEIVAKTDNGDNSNLTTPSTSSSRWPKVEVETLIKLRTNMDSKYQENGPKGPLWEEISAAMRRLGYNRSSKRCKEKWENINKYFKKVKESNKRRPEDSKTCPYFHQLDALYREKSFKLQSAQPPPPENMMSTPLMVRPEQQWPPQPQPQQQQQETRPSSGPQVMMGSAGNDAMEEDEEEEDKDREEEEDEDDDGGSGTYEIVASTPATSVGASE